MKTVLVQVTLQMSASLSSWKFAPSCGRTQGLIEIVDLNTAITGTFGPQRENVCLVVYIRFRSLSRLVQSA